ncbi:hypothetical protein M885DRAFT_245562 [Pelagophyceae sp. CCMP2097]|nr:hypothetical protein M885DRAFT_245562 [Pelagophyceae sp. CCMP2097]
MHRRHQAQSGHVLPQEPRAAPGAPRRHGRRLRRETDRDNGRGRRRRGCGRSRQRADAAPVAAKPARKAIRPPRDARKSALRDDSSCDCREHLALTPCQSRRCVRPSRGPTEFYGRPVELSEGRVSSEGAFPERPGGAFGGRALVPHDISIARRITEDTLSMT